MWQILGHNTTIAYESWPTYDEAKCKDAEVTCFLFFNRITNIYYYYTVKCTKGNSSMYVSQYVVEHKSSLYVISITCPEILYSNKTKYEIKHFLLSLKFE